MHPHLTFGSVSLVSDYLAGKEQIRPFFNGHFREPSSFSRVADQVRSGRRDVLADILADQNRRCGNLAALPAVELLRHPETRAVVTGQQVGLFGGPLYTLYKALSVIELSGQLNRQLGIPVVPVFYLVSEDHDFQEISWAGWVDRDNRYKRIEYSPVPLPARQPACEIRFDFDIVTMIDGWFKQLPETDFSDQLRQQLLIHYAPTKSFSEAFCGWFSELFKEQGLVLLDAADTRLKPLMQPVIERELRDSIAFSAIAATDRMLQESGYHSQLSVRNDRPAVCVLEDGRHSLQRGADGYQNLYSKASYSLSELVARPHMLSPKAALRPIVQDTLLPTVAYVAGPGEISYWAQLKGVYTAYDRPMPVVVPRASFLLVEPKIQRHLERYKIDLTRFLSDPQAEIQVLFKEWIPGDISQGLSVLRQEIDRIWPGLRGEALRLDPTLESVVDKSRDQMVKSLHQLEQRLAQAISARRESSGRQLSAAAEHLVPEGQPQERQLNCVPFLVKFGPSLFEKIGRQLDLLNPAVQVIHLG